MELVDGNYEFSYQLIPEPATFAGIGGLIALALAAYRRRGQVWAKQYSFI